jgi:hypothetical protein
MRAALPSRLAELHVIDGKPAFKVLLDLTLYLTGPTADELEFLLDLFDELCPVPSRDQRYLIDEIVDWCPVHAPLLTDLGREAAARGAKRPFFAPTFRRIAEGRALTAELWDGRSIDDPSGSWSFSCRRTHSKKDGLRAFTRMLMPLSTDVEILRLAALRIADRVEFFSGHGGFAFVYNPWIFEDAFDGIYAQARRFWGIDVEYLNGTLPVITHGIKATNWLTLVGNPFAETPAGANAIGALERIPEVSVERVKNGVAIVAGPEPLAGDQNRPDATFDRYFTIANALRPLWLEDHPDFPGECFSENGATRGWLRRLLDPDGWR